MPRPGLTSGATRDPLPAGATEMGGGMAATAIQSGGKSGAAEIRAALQESRRLFASIALFSAFVNLLMLTGPLFTLQIYDRVLTSRSEATLAVLIAIVALLFVLCTVHRLLGVPIET